MRMDLNNVLQCSRSVQLEASWEPIADSAFNLHKEIPEHAGLFDLSPDYPSKNMSQTLSKPSFPHHP